MLCEAKTSKNTNTGLIAQIYIMSVLFPYLCLFLETILNVLKNEPFIKLVDESNHRPTSC